MTRLNLLMIKARGWLVAATVALAVALPAVSAHALDRLTLKDGNKVIEEIGRASCRERV